jgi:hypothetical protein
MPIPKTYNKDFFKTWTSDMAYILGFMYADGNIVETKRGNHYIAIYTADRELLVAMAKSMQSKHKVAQRNSSTGCVYRIQIGSKEWFADLGTLGLFPNKTKRMQLPCIPPEYFGDFVRGYFDGDGNVWSGIINKYRKTPTKVLQAVFTSGAHGFLVDLRDVLKQKGLQGGGMYSPKNENFTRLIFSSIDALKLYEIMYNARHKLYLKRKKVVFEQFMKLRAK